MTEIQFGYKPMPIHAPFHVSSAYERALFGAFGSGKSYALCAEAIAWMLEQPGIRGGIMRKTVPELRDTTEPIFVEMLPPELYQQCEVRRSGGHIERIVFPNGSTALFRSLDDWHKHRSLNLGFLAIDEANEIDEETYLGMMSRVRQREPTAEGRRYGAAEIARRGIWLATNPNGHDWLWGRLVSEKKHRNTEYFKSTSLDNPHLTMEYVESLLEYPRPWVLRYVLCSFDDFAGQIYEEWGWDTHVVEPFDTRAGDIHWMGFDPGTRVANAGLWVAVNKATRTLTGIAEYEEPGLAAAKHALGWRAIEAKHKMNVQWRVADPNSITVRDRGSNMRLHDQYRRLGFNFALGPSQPKHRIPMLGQLIHLGRFKVTRNCPRTYEEIKNYRWEDITPMQRAKGADPPDKPLKKDEHLVDCSQYVSSRLVAPPGYRPTTRPQNFDEEVRAAIRKQQVSRGRLASQEHDLGSVVV